MDLLNSLIQIFLSCTVIFNIADACRKDQVTACRDAAKSNKLESINAGGKCLAKHYVHFTHMCTVNNYAPSTDFCCCVTDRKVLCCRYHQNWEKFRCTQAEDTIDTISSNSVFGDSPLQKLPLEILIPVIVGPILCVVCCVVCIIKCCCYNYDSDDNEYCDIPCLRKCRDQQPEKHNIYHSQQQRGLSTGDEEQPLSSATTRYVHPSGVGSQFSTESTTSETKLLPPSRSSDGPLPSAPPSESGGGESAFVRIHKEHNIGCMHHPGYSRLDSESSSILTGEGIPYQCGYSRSVSSGLTNQNSYIGADVLSASSGNCQGCWAGVGTPPPTYDEHHRDRVLS